METKDLALVLEGGGMRGVFTAGVLDYCLDNDIEFPYTVAVSAGSGNAFNFMAKQRGRTKVVDIDFLEKYDYIGWKTMLKKGTLMDFDMLFDKFPNEYYPYDFDTFFKNPNKLEVVACNIETGEAVYFDERADKGRLNKICMASCSLPFACKIVELDGMRLLDGGIANAIPYSRAFEKGYEKCLVILTRPRGYRKKGEGLVFPGFLYRKYPVLQEKLRKLDVVYNNLLAELEKLEDEEKVLVIRPEDTMGVDRLEKNHEKLLALYNHGYEIADKFFSNQKQWEK